MPPRARQALPASRRPRALGVFVTFPCDLGDLRTLPGRTERFSLGAVIWRFQPPLARVPRYLPLSKTTGRAILASHSPGIRRMPRLIRARLPV
jgi:hypothetical protein